MLIKYGVILGILCSSVVVSLSAHGMEKGIDGKGNIKGMGEQILCLKEDFIYLQDEIQSLMEECN